MKAVSDIRRYMARRPVVCFFGLAFGLSWAAWLPTAAVSHGYNLPALPAAVSGLIGAFCPALAALLTVAATGEVRGLVARFRRWRVGIGWYAFAMLWPVALSLVATGVQVLLGAATPDFADPPARRLYPLPPEAFAAGPWVLLPFIFVQQLLLGSTIGEEPGWRGYAQPGLQARLGWGRASLVVGFLWGVWHLPRFLTAGDPLATGSVAAFAWFLVGIVGAAVVYGWLFERTGGSLLPVMVLHAATATSGLFLAAASGPPWVAPALTWACAVAVLVRAGMGGGQRKAAVAAAARV